MKLFQQMLVAPAALGLMAPMAVTATELNINGVSDYSAASVESQTFSDVHPSDWAFKALTDLADRHGCAVATPSGSISRYEAASLLNKCLGDVAQITEEERLLLSEFGPEIAVLKGRVDGLEARIGEFEAGAFSSTTTMSGVASFVVGSVDMDNDTSDSTTMNYTYQLNMNTSFSGDDLLYTRIKTGNFNDSNFGSSTQGTYLAATDKGLSTDEGKAYLRVDKIWYQFPVGDNFTFWVGPAIENYYMLASAPSIYKPVGKQFALGGNGTVYGSSTQAGFGAAWTQSVDDPSDGRFAISYAYTNKGGEESSTSQGLFGDKDTSKWLTKLEYGTPKWQASFAIAQTHAGDGVAAWSDGYYATAKGKTRSTGADETAMGLRGYWRPDDVGFVPEIQVGVDVSSIDDQAANSGNATSTMGWMVGLGWPDLFTDGNRGGVAFGQRVHGTEFEGVGSDAADDTFSWEAYYTFQITDGISITPTLFGNQEPSTDSKDNNGALVLTEFRF